VRFSIDSWWDIAAILRSVFWLLCALRYGMYVEKNEREGGNGGKFVVTMLLSPVVVLLVTLGLLTPLVRLMGINEEGMTFFIPQIALIACLVLVDRHKR
jgi:hypothetical protein